MAMKRVDTVLFVMILAGSGLAVDANAQGPYLGPPEAIAIGPPLLQPLPKIETTPVLGSDKLPTVDGRPWWVTQVANPQRPGSQSMPLTLHQLAVETLRYSQQVEALRVVPAIRQTQVIQADAEFDAIAFLDAKWFDRDEPVGNFLATGGEPRLLEDTLTEDFGLRRRNRLGTSLEVAQRLGYQDSNSTFFTPNDQAQTRFAISVTQPLLRGAGRVFNESIVVLAQQDVRIASDQFAEGLQDHLLRVAEQYWELYLQRSIVLQQGRNLQRAHDILSGLQHREAIDALRSQIERAKAKVATREAGWLRAQAGVRNAEATLRSLVNSPNLSDCLQFELLPLDVPRANHHCMSLCVARQLALSQRPEVDNQLTQIRSASVQLDVAQNEILPSLALVFETYVNGLQGQHHLAKSYGDQFSRGAPSYSAGLLFEMPLGNRRARAQLRQRQLELHQLYTQLNATISELSAEVEIALREVDVTHAELVSRRTSLDATASEVEYLYQRWRRLPGHDQSASLFLEDLLDAEDRLVDQEQRVAAAQTRFAVAQVELKRALGELVIRDANCCVQCAGGRSPVSPSAAVGPTPAATGPPAAGPLVHAPELAPQPTPAPQPRFPAPAAPTGI
jgi:outer membrane protein TolC